jgi:hypothetical protein
LFSKTEPPGLLISCSNFDAGHGDISTGDQEIRERLFSKREPPALLISCSNFDAGDATFQQEIKRARVASDYS